MAVAQFPQHTLLSQSLSHMLRESNDNTQVEECISVILFMDGCSVLVRLLRRIHLELQQTPLASPEQDMLTCAVANDCLVLIRELSFLSAVASRELRNVSSIALVYGFMEFPECFEPACMACEELLAARGSFSIVRLLDIPRAVPILMSMSPRRLAIACRVLSLLVFEPERREPEKPLSAAHMQAGWLEEKRHYAAARGMQEPQVYRISSDDLSRAVPMLTRNTVCENQLVLAHAAPLFRRVAALMAVLPPAPHPEGTDMVTPRPHTEEQDRQFRSFVSMLPQGAHVAEALEGDGRGALDMLTNITIDDIARRYEVDVMDIYAVLRNVPGMSLLEDLEEGNAASVRQAAREEHSCPATAWLWRPVGQGETPESPLYGVQPMGVGADTAAVAGRGGAHRRTPPAGTACITIRPTAQQPKAESSGQPMHSADAPASGVKLCGVRQALALCPPARRMLAAGLPPLTVAWVVKAGMHDMHQLMSGIMSMPAEQRKECGADLIMLCLGGSHPGGILSDVVQTQWGAQGRGRGSAHADWAMHSNAMALLVQWLTAGTSASAYAPASPLRTFAGDASAANEDSSTEVFPYGRTAGAVENTKEPNLARPDWGLLQRAAASGVLPAFPPSQGATAESWHALRRVARVSSPADPLVPPHIRLQCILEAAAGVQLVQGKAPLLGAPPCHAPGDEPAAAASSQTASKGYAGGEIFGDGDCAPPPRGGGVVRLTMGGGGAADASSPIEDGNGSEGSDGDTITSRLGDLVGALIPEQLRAVPRELLARMGLGQVLDAAEALTDDPPTPRSIRRRHKLNQEPLLQAEALQGSGLEDLGAWLASDSPAKAEGVGTGTDAVQVPIVTGFKSMWRPQLQQQYAEFQFGEVGVASKRHPVLPPWLRGAQKPVRVLAQGIDEATLSSQQTAVLCVLAGMSMSRMKRFAQAELGAAGLPRLLWQQAADIDWRYEQPPADWTPPRLHGAGCRCTPESTHRIQWLRLLHSLLEKQEARSGADRWLGAASRLLSMHEATMLHTQEVLAAGWTGTHASASSPSQAVQGGVVWAPGAVGAAAAVAAVEIAQEANGYEARVLAALRPASACSSVAAAVDQASALDASRAALQSCVLSPAGKVRAEESALAAQLELLVKRCEQVGDASGVDWRTYLLLAFPSHEPARAREALEKIAVPMGTGVGSGVTAMLTLSVHPLVAAVAPRPGLLHALHALGRWGDTRGPTRPMLALQPYFPWPKLQLQHVCARELVDSASAAETAQQLHFVGGSVPTPPLRVRDLRVLPDGKPRVMRTQVPHAPPSTIAHMGHGVVQALGDALGSSNSLALFGVMDIAAASVGAVTSHSLLTRTMQTPLPEDAGLDMVHKVQPPPMQRLFAANAALASGAAGRPSAALPDAWSAAWGEAAKEQPGAGILPGSSPVGRLYPDGVTRQGALTGGSCPSVGLLGRLLLALEQLPYRAPLRFWVASCVDTCLRPAPPSVRQWAARSGVLTRMLGDLMLLFDRNIKRLCKRLEDTEEAEGVAGAAAAAVEGVPLLIGGEAEITPEASAEVDGDAHDAAEDSMDTEGCGGVTERHLMQSAFDVLGEVTKLNMQGVALLDSMLSPAAASALLRLAFERPVDSNVAVRNCMLSLYYAGVGHVMRRAAELGHAPPQDVASPERFMQMPVMHAVSTPAAAPGQSWEDTAKAMPVVDPAVSAACVEEGALNPMPGWSLMSRLPADADGRVRLPAELAADWFGQAQVVPTEYTTMQDTPLLHGTHRSGVGAGPTGGECVSSGFSRGLHTHVVPLVHAIMGAVRSAEEVTQETLSNVNTALLHCVVAHAQGRLPALVAALQRQDAAMAGAAAQRGAVAKEDRGSEAQVAAGVTAAASWLPCLRSAAQWAHSRGNVYEAPDEDSDLDGDEAGDGGGSVASGDGPGTSPDSGAGVYEAATAKRKAGHASKNPVRHSTVHVPRTGVLASYVALLDFWQEYYSQCDRDLPSLVCSTGFSYGVWREVVLLLAGSWSEASLPPALTVALESVPTGVQAPTGCTAQLPKQSMSWLHPAEYGSVAISSQQYRDACALFSG